jgi:protein involved in polysaccharide export with SLBB domain
MNAEAASSRPAGADELDRAMADKKQDAAATQAVIRPGDLLNVYTPPMAGPARAATTGPSTIPVAATEPAAQTLRVGEDGAVDVAGIGKIQAGGKSTADLESLMGSALGGGAAAAKVIVRKVEPAPPVDSAAPATRTADTTLMAEETVDVVIVVQSPTSPPTTEPAPTPPAPIDSPPGP